MATLNLNEINTWFEYEAEEEKKKQADEATRLAFMKAQMDRDSLTQSQIDAQVVIGQANQSIAQEQHSASLKVDIANAKAKEVYGTDLNAAGNQLADLAIVSKLAYDEAQRLNISLAQTRAASQDLSNPFAMVLAGIQLPNKVAEFNMFANRHNMAEDRIKEITSNTTAAAVMNNATKQTTSEALLLAETKKASAIAENNIAMLRIANVDKNVDQITRLQSMDRQGLEQAQYMANLKHSTMGIQFRRAEAEALNENRSERAMDARTRLESKQQNLEALQKDLLDYNVGAKILGIRQLSSTQELLQNIKSPMVTLAMVRGQEANLTGVAANTVRVGTSAGESAVLLTELKSRRVNAQDADQPENILVNTVMAGLYKDPRVSKDPAQRAALANAEALKLSDSMSKGIATQGDANMYRAPPIAAVLAAAPVVANDPFVKTVLSPQAELNPNVPTNPDAIIGSGVGMILKDPASLNMVAKGIATYFKGAMATNNAVRNYEALGLPVQKDYQAKLTVGNLWGTSTMDLTDETAVKRLLMIQANVTAGGINYYGRTSGAN